MPTHSGKWRDMDTSVLWLVALIIVLILMMTGTAFPCDALSEPVLPPTHVEYNNQIGVEIRLWKFTWYTVVTYRHIYDDGSVSTYPFILQWYQPGKPDEVWADLATPPAGLCADLRKVR